MAVFTAAALAVGAAIATTTAATVATAVVAVSAAVGVAGLAVGAIGMATGNKDLMFAGKIMGYVGLAGGLAGGLIGGVGAVMGNTGLSFTQGFADAFAGASQHLSEGWSKGVGSVFSGGEKVTGALGSTPTGSPAPVSGVSVESPQALSGMAETPVSNVAAPSTDLATPVMSSPMSSAPTTSMPVAPTVSAPSAPYASMNNGVASWAPNATPAVSGGGGLVSSVSNMPDWMKYSLMTTGAQGLTGMAGGLFQGNAAKAQLAQQQLENDRANERWNTINSQANQVPTIRFA